MMLSEREGVAIKAMSVGAGRAVGSETGPGFHFLDEVVQVEIAVVQRCR